MIAPGDVIFILALLNLAVWLPLSVWIARTRHHEPIPTAVVAASIIAVIAGCIGGAITGYSFLPPEHRFLGPIPFAVTQTVAAAWRMGMLSAGIYGAISATARARTRREQDRA